MADSTQERFPHILRPEGLDASAASVHARNSEPQHSSVPFSLSWAYQTSLLTSPQHSHPEPARLVLENVHEPGVYPMTSGDMGNVVMQSAGEGTDQYVVLIGNIPWKEKWQDLKDLVRQWTPNVERAEIYTSGGRSRGFGYVRIKGLEAAKKVQDNLDGYVWNGRALVAKLGNLQYDCPVGGATAKLGPGQILPPQYSQGGRSQSSFQNLPGTLPGSAVWQNPLPASVSFTSIGNSWESDAWYRHTYQECAYWHNQAAFHTDKSKELWRRMTETTQAGRLGEVRDLQKQFNEHREAARQASGHAMGLGRSLQMRFPLNAATIPAPGEMYSHAYLPMPMVPYGASGYHSQLMLPATPIANPSNAPPGMENSMIPGSIPHAPTSFMMPVNMANIHVAPSPFYVTPPNGLPVNLSHGAVQTECRSVFIGNLPYGTAWKELKEFLEGSIRVEVPRNADNRAKGHAIATFESSEAANQACIRYHNTSFKGRQLRVRMDRHYETKRAGADVMPGVGEDSEDTRTPTHTERTRGNRNTEGQRYMPPIVVDGSNIGLTN